MNKRMKEELSHRTGKEEIKLSFSDDYITIYIEGPENFETN